MPKSYTITFRVRDEVKDYLDSEAKRLRMATGEPVSVSDIIRGYIDEKKNAQEKKTEHQK